MICINKKLSIKRINRVMMNNEKISINNFMNFKETNQVNE